jgi:hypothetical protein
VTTVVIDCGTQSFTVSGTVNGLTGSGLQLSDGAGDTIPVGSASFSFALASGTAYTIGVAANPTSPWETCSVTSGATGSVTNANVTGVVVDCTVNPYTVAVDVSGLSNPRFFMSDGTSSVTITGNGTFTFPAVVSSGQTYDVTFTNQPSYQTCSVTSGNASGTMQGASIVVEVACSPPQYPVTIYVEGVPGTQCGSVTLFDGTDQIALSSQPTSETGETFPTYLAPGTSYALSYTGDTLCRCCVVTGTDSSGQPVCASGSITPGAAFDSGTISGPYSTVLTCYELIQ